MTDKNFNKECVNEDKWMCEDLWVNLENKFRKFSKVNKNFFYLRDDERYFQFMKLIKKIKN